MSIEQVAHYDALSRRVREIGPWATCQPDLAEIQQRLQQAGEDHRLFIFVAICTQFAAYAPDEWQWLVDEVGRRVIP